MPNKDLALSATEVDQLLHERLESLECPQTKMPMDLGQFWVHYFADLHVPIKSSSYKTLVKWARAMDKEGLLILKERKGRKQNHGAPPSIFAVGSAQTRVFRGGKMEKEDDSDTCPATTTMAVTTPAAVDQSETPSREERQKENTDDAVEYQFKATAHLKLRQKERQIQDHEIEKVLRDAKGVKKRSSDGRRNLEANGLEIVKKHDKIITAWKTGENGVPMKDVLRHWLQQTPKLKQDASEEVVYVVDEKIRAIPSYVVRQLDFLFANNSDTMVTNEDAIVACESYLTKLKKKDSGGQIGKVAFLAAAKSKEDLPIMEWQHILKQEARNLACIADTVRQLHDTFHPTSWSGTDIQDTLSRLVVKDDESKEEKGKGKGKGNNKANGKGKGKTEEVRLSDKLIKLLDTKLQLWVQRFQNQGNKWPTKERLALLLLRDKVLFSTADSAHSDPVEILISWVTQLGVPCHIISSPSGNGQEQQQHLKEGPPPYVTIGIGGKARKNGHGKSRSKLTVTGLGNRCKALAPILSKALGLPVSVGKFNTSSWNQTHGEGVSPFVAEGSPTIEFQIVLRPETVTRIYHLLRKDIPRQFRRLAKDGEAVRFYPSAALKAKVEPCGHKASS